MTSAAPDVISSFGFARAPVSQFLVIASGISSITVALLPRRYQSLFSLHWLDILNKKQVWRLVTSQLVADNSMDIVSNCILIYYFLVLERRFGSLKYMTFIIKTWALSLGLYFAVMKFKLLDGYVNNIELVPSGLYGPIFASLIQYYSDIPLGESSGVFGLVVSRKIFVYMIALSMLLNSPNTLLISTCGIISGIVYKTNIFSFQQWYMPKAVSGALSSIFSYLFPRHEKDTVSKRAYMGATAEIHEDMVFDHMLRRQHHWRPNSHANVNNGRTQSGQGYSNVINPSFLNFFQSPPPQTSAAEAPIENDSIIRSDLSEEKIQTLVDMGFSRDSVISALASSNNDVQQATGILLAP